MTLQTSPSPARRQFLTAALAAAAGSVATGSILAVLQERDSVGRVPATSLTAPSQAPLPAAADGSLTQDLLARLAAAEGENVRLRAELDGALRRLGVAESARAETTSETELLRSDLTAAQEQAGLLAGLVALYESLEKIDLGEQVAEGINTVAAYFSELDIDLTELGTGLDLSEEALALFDADVPALESARSWLGDQLARLALAWELAGQALRDALSGLDPILDMLAAWFDKILGWVPFEWGNRARSVMAALFTVLEETPQTIDGGQREVLASLDKWFKPETGQREAAVRTRLVAPIRERGIGAARRTAGLVEKTRESFQQDLVARTVTAVADRQEIQRQISLYRADHGLE